MSFQRVSVLKVAGSANRSFSRPQGEPGHLEPSWRGSFGTKRNKCSSRNISHGKTRQLCCTKWFISEPQNVIGEEFCDGVSALPLLVALLVCFGSWWGGQVCHFSGTSNTNGEHLTAKTLQECKTALTITLLNYLLGLLVLLSFCRFFWISLWSNVWSLETHYFCPNFKVPLTDWLTDSVTDQGKICHIRRFKVSIFRLELPIYVFDKEACADNTCFRFLGMYIASTAANLVIEFVIDCWYHSVCLASLVPPSLT